MKITTKSSMVSPTQVADLRHAKTVLPKHRSAIVGAKPKSSRPNTVRSKNHLAWYVALNTKQSEKKSPSIPQIKWKCPPKFSLNTGWHVAAGEGSQEGDAQKCRGTTAIEALYKDLTAIPPSPSTCPPTGSDRHDNCGTPIIPIIPIEEVDAEMPDSGINPQPRASCPLVSESFPFSHGESLSEAQDHQPPHDMLQSLGNGDMEIAAAAAIVAAAVQREGQIDTELLIKFLTDAEMVKKLMDGNGLEDEAPPSPKPDTCLPLPSSKPASLVDKRDLRKAVVSDSTPPVLPCSKVEPETSKLVSKQGCMHGESGLTHASKAMKRNRPSPRLDSNRPTKKMACEHGRQVDQIAREQKVRPLVPSTLRPDEKMIDRHIKRYGGPTTVTSISVKPIDPLNPSASKPNMEAVKKMILDYGAPNVARVTHTPTAAKRTSPLNSDRPMIAFEHGGPTSSRIDQIVRPLLRSTFRPNVTTGVKPPENPLTSKQPNMEAAKKMIHDYGAPDMAPCALNMEDINRTAEKYLLPDRGWAQSHSWTNLHATGILHPSMTLPDHLQSLTEQHGLIHQNFPKICQSGNAIEMNPNYQKPCLYFSSSTGCRNGYKCLYQHDVSKLWPGR